MLFYVNCCKYPLPDEMGISIHNFEFNVMYVNFGNAAHNVNVT